MYYFSTILVHFTPENIQFVIFPQPDPTFGGFLSEYAVVFEYQLDDKNLCLIEFSETSVKIIK